jgi:hypothetical protein
MKFKALKTNAQMLPSIDTGAGEPPDRYLASDIIEINTKQFETLIRLASQDKPIKAELVVHCLDEFLMKILTGA